MGRLRNKHGRGALARALVPGLTALIVLLLATLLVLNERRPAAREAQGAAILDAFYRCHDLATRTACLKELASEVVSHGEEGPVSDIFDENQQSPQVFDACHVFFHFVGQAAYGRYGSVGRAMAHGSHVCFSGFYHGVLEGYFMANHIVIATSSDLDALKARLPSICTDARAEEPSTDYHECLHGLGHALMFATSDDLPQALAVCDALSALDAGWCYSGVFMENSTSTTNPDHPSKYLKADDPLYPCDALASRYLHTCYQLQSSYFAQLTHGDWSKNVALCLSAPLEGRADCFDGYGQNLAGYTTDLATVEANCLRAPAPYRLACIEGAVGGLGSMYKDPFPMVGALCASFGGEYRAACYEDSWNVIGNRRAGNRAALASFCASIAEPDLKAECASRIQ